MRQEVNLKWLMNLYNMIKEFEVIEGNAKSIALR